MTVLAVIIIFVSNYKSKTKDSQQQDVLKSCCCESFVCNCVRENAASGNCPISLLGVSIPVRLPLGHSQFHQLAAKTRSISTAGNESSGTQWCNEY